MKHSRLRWPGYFAAVLGVLWLGLFPLWQDLTYAHITRTKWYGALALGSAGLAAAVIAVIVLLCRRSLRRAMSLSLAQLIAVMYFGWVALSAWQGRLADSVNTRQQQTVLWGAIRYEGLITQLCYGAIFLTMSCFRPQKTPVLIAAAAGLGAFSAVVALQYAGLNPLNLYPEGRSIFTNYEFQGTIGNIDMVSGYLCLIVPLMLGSYVLAPRGGWYLLAASALGVLQEGLMGVQSGMIAMLCLGGLLAVLMLLYPEYRFRGALALGCMALALSLSGFLQLPWLDKVEHISLGFSMKGAALLLAALLLFGGAALLRRRPGPAFPLKIVICLVLAVLVLGVAFVAFYPFPESGSGLWELHETLQGRGQDEFGSWRWGVWRHTLDMSRESPFFGTGPDTFYYAMHTHLANAGATLGENFDNPHNEYLAILSNNGLPALALYVALLCAALLRCLRMWRKSTLSLALAMPIVCYAVQGVFSFSICLVAPMFWAILGMAVAGQGAMPSRTPRLRGSQPLRTL